MYLLIAVLVGLVLGIATSVQQNRFYPRRLFLFLLAGLVIGGAVSCLRVIPAGHVGIVEVYKTVGPATAM